VFRHVDAAVQIEVVIGADVRIDGKDVVRIEQIGVAAGELGLEPADVTPIEGQLEALGRIALRGVSATNANPSADKSRRWRYWYVIRRQITPGEVSLNNNRRFHICSGNASNLTPFSGQKSIRE
jgi:hypothetical protein